MEEQVAYDRIAEEIIDQSIDKGYIRGTAKGNYIRDYIDRTMFQGRVGRETVKPTVKKLYDVIYEVAGKTDKAINALKKEDANYVTKALEMDIKITPEQAEYIQKHALGKDLKVNGDVLTVKRLRPTEGSVDAAISTMKNLVYSSTIGMNIRTMTMNLVTQPMMAFSYAGLPMVEGMKMTAGFYKEALQSWRQTEKGAKMRAEMESTGLTISKSRLFNPEAPLAKGALEGLTEVALSNMTYSEYVARYVSGRIGYEAFKRGKISEAEAGQIVTINGKKVAKGWADTFNFEYDMSTLPLWMGTMQGRIFGVLSTFGLKNTELHVDMVKKAEFKQWLGESEKIFKRKDIGTPEKFKEIVGAYEKNSARIGMAREAVLGLSMAMVLGQIFDIDMDEFLTKGMGFGISNPLSNLVFGAGGFTQDVGDKFKPLIPGRGAVRSIDKMIGTDILSNYQDYGNVPQISDLIK
jgi:hypothetical protein